MNVYFLISTPNSSCTIQKAACNSPLLFICFLPEFFLVTITLTFTTLLQNILSGLKDWIYPWSLSSVAFTITNPFSTVGLSWGSLLLQLQGMFKDINQYPCTTESPTLTWNASALKTHLSVKLMNTWVPWRECALKVSVISSMSNHGEIRC